MGSIRVIINQDFYKNYHSKKPGAMTQQIASKRIRRDLDKIIKAEENGILVEFNESDCFQAKALLEGPEGTYWEGGVFELDIKYP